MCFVALHVVSLVFVVFRLHLNKKCYVIPNERDFLKILKINPQREKPLGVKCSQKFRATRIKGGTEW